MADYAPLIKKAVAGLVVSNSTARSAVYDRARNALITQLRSVLPPLSEADITRERFALEDSIKSVELDLSISQTTTKKRSGGIIANLADPFIASFGDAYDSIFKPPNNFPSADVIPPQVEQKAFSFSLTRRGPLDLITDPPIDPLDADQTNLYFKLRQQLQHLLESVPSQERSQITDAVNEFLQFPAAWSAVESKKLLWLSANSLRRKLAQHDALQSDRDPHPNKLPPTVAEALREPVQTWNVFVLGDEDLRQLDIQSIGPSERSELLKALAAAKPLVEEASKNREVVTERAAAALKQAFATTAEPHEDVHARLEHEITAGTSRNFLAQILRQAYLFCQSIINPSTDEERAISAEYKKGVAKSVGEKTVAVAAIAVAAGTTFTLSHSAAFFEFAAANSVFIKEYVVLAFNNNQLTEIVEIIRSARLSITRKE